VVWAKKCGSALVDLGSPLGNAISISKSSASASDVVGYSILQAESSEEAQKLLDGHPHLGWNKACEIELHESLPMPG